MLDEISKTRFKTQGLWIIKCWMKNSADVFVVKDRWEECHAFVL